MLHTIVPPHCDREQSWASIARLACSLAPEGCDRRAVIGEARLAFIMNGIKVPYSVDDLLDLATGW